MTYIVKQGDGLQEEVTIGYSNPTLCLEDMFIMWVTLQKSLSLLVTLGTKGLKKQ